jgi:hypothetical protein
MPKAKSKSKNKKKSQSRLPTPSKELSLSDNGYRLHNAVSTRHKALRKCAKKFGALTVLKRVNLIRNITQSNSNNEKRLSEDVNYLKGLYKRNKNKKGKSK